jgi:ankyrin repeat protein
VRYFIEKKGVDVNAKVIDALGIPQLPIFAAIDNSNVNVLEYLVSKGANVNATGSDGKTPLMAAAEFCSNPEVISALLNYGANAKIKDINNKMAVQYALDNKHLRNTQAVRRLATESNYGIPAGNAPRQDVQKQYAPTEIPPVEMNRVKMKPIEFSSGQNRDKPDSPREGRYSKKTVRYYDNSTRKWKN